MITKMISHSNQIRRAAHLDFLLGQNRERDPLIATHHVESQE